MGWLGKNIERMIHLPKPLLVSHIACKFFLGLGLGLLLASYLKMNWRLPGWIVLALTVIADAPSVCRILKDRSLGQSCRPLTVGKRQ
jgi:hypothetical protein